MLWLLVVVVGLALFSFQADSLVNKYYRREKATAVWVRLCDEEHRHNKWRNTDLKRSPLSALRETIYLLNNISMFSGQIHLNLSS